MDWQDWLVVGALVLLAVAVGCAAVHGGGSPEEGPVDDTEGQYGLPLCGLCGELHSGRLRCRAASPGNIMIV